MQQSVRLILQFRALSFSSMSSKVTQLLFWYVVPLSENQTSVAPAVAPEKEDIKFSACKDAGTIRGWEQNEGGVNIAQQRMQSRVLVRVRSATTQGSRCCQQWVLLSQLTSLLRRPLPPLQALQCTRLFFVPWCELSFASGAPPTSCEFINVRALFKGGVNFA